jgi:hypothetical protein
MLLTDRNFGTTFRKDKPGQGRHLAAGSNPNHEGSESNDSG